MKTKKFSATSEIDLSKIDDIPKIEITIPYEIMDKVQIVVPKGVSVTINQLFPCSGDATVTIGKGKWKDDKNG